MWRNAGTGERRLEASDEVVPSKDEQQHGAAVLEPVGPGATPEESARRFRICGEQKQVERIVTLFASDAVFFLPVTDRFHLRGRAEIKFLLGGVFAAVDRVRFHTDFGEGAHRVLVYRGTVGSHAYEETLLLRFNEHNEIAEIFASIRPLDGMMWLSDRLGPLLIRRNGRFGRALAVSAVMGILAGFWSFVDRKIMWLIRPRRRG